MNPLFPIFHPFALEKITSLKNSGRQFSHYTSAEAALNIIRTQKIWLRSASIMNDYAEVQHGENCLKHCLFSTGIGARVEAIFERLQPNSYKEFVDGFWYRQPERVSQTYMLSISEHAEYPAPESHLGRLSMWRAYGGDTNVALVFKREPILGDTNAFNLISSPVLYCGLEIFEEKLTQVVEKLEQNFELLKSYEFPTLQIHFFGAFHSAILSAKHSGFEEENEWRLLYSPTMWPSDKLELSVENISGVPQKVYQLPFQNFPENGLQGATLPEILDRIIIGPTQTPYPIYDALVTELTNIGVADAHNKVRVSNIPLRR